MVAGTTTPLWAPASAIICWRELHVCVGGYLCGIVRRAFDGRSMRRLPCLVGGHAEIRPAPWRPSLCRKLMWLPTLARWDPYVALGPLLHARMPPRLPACLHPPAMLALTWFLCCNVQALAASERAATEEATLAAAIQVG